MYNHISFLVILIAVSFPFSLRAQRHVTLDLQEAIRLANDSSLASFRYKNLYQSGYWEYRAYLADRLPSLNLDLTPVSYYRYITQRYDSRVDQDVYRGQQIYTASGGLTLSQNFAPLGGAFYLESSLEYMRNFGTYTDNQYSSIPIRLGYKQEQLGYNALRWSRRIEPMKYEKVKKQFLYNMETVSESAVNYFFALALAQVEFDLAEENVASADTLYAIGAERFKIAAIAQTDLLTLQLDKVNARNSLQNAQISLKRAMSTLASFLGIESSADIQAELPSTPRHFEISTDEAVRYALEQNPTLLEQRQSVLEARQSVDKTRVESRLNVSLNASVGLNQMAPNLSEAYRDLMRQDVATLTLSIPLLDWGVRKGKYNMARNNLAVAETAARQEEVTLEEDVVMTVSEFGMQQSLVQSATEALDLADLAYERIRQSFILGKADMSGLTLARNRQQEAHKNYVSALQNYWASYYKIRRLTLYDFEFGIPLSAELDRKLGVKYTGL